MQLGQRVAEGQVAHRHRLARHRPGLVRRRQGRRRPGRRRPTCGARRRCSGTPTWCKDFEAARTPTGRRGPRAARAPEGVSPRRAAATASRRGSRSPSRRRRRPVAQPRVGVEVRASSPSAGPCQSSSPSASSTGWVLSDIYESDLLSRHQGRAPRSPRSRTRTGVEGKVDWVPARSTRHATGQGAVPSRDPDHLLKQDMYATVTISVASREALALPHGAVLHLGDQTVVFVDRGTLPTEGTVRAGTHRGRRRVGVKWLPFFTASTWATRSSRRGATRSTRVLSATACSARSYVTTPGDAPGAARSTSPISARARASYRSSRCARPCRP